MEGLEYLHREGIIHGDLRGVGGSVPSQWAVAHDGASPLEQSNILVAACERAIIADFGLSVYLDAQSQEYNSMRAGNISWLAPELRPGGARKSVRPTQSGDIFSFAMTCIQVMS